VNGSATRARVAHALLILAGLGILLYPLTFGAQPEISCRGVQMRPGEVCGKAEDAQVQTYEDRLRTADQAKPVLVVVGALVVGFGTALLVSDLRRRAAPPPAPPS